jgi:hypothetical protein
MTAQELDSSVEIIETPHRLSRLLGIFPDNRAYLATWLTLKITTREALNDAGTVVKLKTPKIDYRSELAILTREPDGNIKSWGPLAGSEPFPPDWDVRLRYQPPSECLISPAGFRRAMSNEQPNVHNLFQRLVAVFDRFLDLSRGITGQRELAELLAVYVLSTWLSDAYAAFPYLWPNGDKGSGKTKALSLVARLSYLGQVILAGGTYAALRDLAEYGATLCFDDAENLSDPKKSDPDKRALLLAGNRKGAVVPIKEPEGKNGWQIRNVSAYCPKVFSAIRLPDAVLSRRTIVLPLVRSADPERANHDIEEERYWPHDRRRLVDDLWTFGLHYLPAAKRAYEQTESADLTGPGFEPWRPLLATATVLKGAGLKEILERIRKVATAYQSEKADLEYPDATRLAVIAIAQLADVWTFVDVLDVSVQAPVWLATNIQFTASQVAEKVNILADDEGLVDDGESFTNARKVGRILDRLRISQERGKTAKRTRERIISRGDAVKLLRAYVPPRQPEPKGGSQANMPSNVQNVQNGRVDVSVSPQDHLNKTSKTSGNVQTSNTEPDGDDVDADWEEDFEWVV